MDYIKIGKFIACVRKEKNMTQAELAEKLSITDRAVSKWERGRGFPDASILLLLCETLNIQVNELLVEELSELIQAVVKLQRWDNGETTLRYNIDEIYNNLYEELGDVIIMMLQFIHKNNIECEKLLNKICKKLIRYYETKQE